MAKDIFKVKYIPTGHTYDFTKKECDRLVKSEPHNFQVLDKDYKLPTAEDAPSSIQSKVLGLEPDVKKEESKKEEQKEDSKEDVKEETKEEDKTETKEEVKEEVKEETPQKETKTTKKASKKATAKKTNK